jgi:hypothetical protein
MLYSIVFLRAVRKPPKLRPYEIRREKNYEKD